jgi:cell division protease FtsH
MASQRPWQVTGGPLRPEVADIGRLGRRLLRKVVSTARAEDAPTLPGLLAEHLGPQVASLPVVADQWPNYEHVNVQIGLEQWLRAAGRSHELVGITGLQHRMFGLADLAQPSTAEHGPGVGSVAMTSFPTGPDGAARPCVQCGLYLVVDDGRRLALLIRRNENHGPDENLEVEVLCPDPAHGKRVLGELRNPAVEHNVFRRQVVSFDQEIFGPRQSLLHFHVRPQVSRDGLVLAPGLLDAIEAQVVGVARHRERLRASGQHLKRGLLLHGPSGTGRPTPCATCSAGSPS